MWAVSCLSQNDLHKNSQEPLVEYVGMAVIYLL